LLQQGAGVVLLTLGAGGATAVGPGFVEHVDAPAVQVVDTIGAGDSFAGAVLTWWDEHGRPSLAEASTARAALAFAVQVAAITCSRAGADPPRRGELP
jgi:fructokinase